MKIIKSLLAADADHDFLMQLNGTDIETLVVCIRNRVEGVKIEHEEVLTVNGWVVIPL